EIVGELRRSIAFLAYTHVIVEQHGENDDGRSYEKTKQPSNKFGNPDIDASKITCCTDGATDRQDDKKCHHRRHPKHSKIAGVISLAQFPATFQGYPAGKAFEDNDRTNKRIPK